MLYLKYSFVFFKVYFACSMTLKVLFLSQNNDDFCHSDWFMILKYFIGALKIHHGKRGLYMLNTVKTLYLYGVILHPQDMHRLPSLLNTFVHFILQSQNKCHLRLQNTSNVAFLFLGSYTLFED